MENIPKSGILGLAIMGGMGFFWWWDYTTAHREDL